LPIKIDYKGVEKLARSIFRMEAEMKDGVKGVVQQLGKSTKRLAQNTAPRGETGALIEAITYKNSGIHGGWKSEIKVGIPARNNFEGKRVPYGDYINRGSVLRGAVKNWGSQTGAVDTIGFFSKAIDYAHREYPIRMKRVMGRIVRG